MMMASSVEGQERDDEELVLVKSSSNNYSSKCEDCGNQAKKDCGYSRCRTCCKNKGFQCQTHIRSTWIPVDRRRQRSPLMVMDPSSHPTTTYSNHHHLLQGDDHNNDIIHNIIPKRHNHNPFSEEMEFPAAMSSVAIFSCVRVRSMDDSVNEIAYQTSVNIGGHIFSGLLYDQGPADNNNNNNNEQQKSFNNNNNNNHRHRSGEGSKTHTPPLVHHHQQQHNLNLMMMSTSDAIHVRHNDAATFSSLPPPTTTAHEQFFPLPNSFRSGMQYF